MNTHGDPSRMNAGARPAARSSSRGGGRQAAFADNRPAFAAQQALQRQLAGNAPVIQRVINSPRFQGSGELDQVDAGTLVIDAQNSRANPSMVVRIIQQALLDLRNIPGMNRVGNEVVVNGLYDEATESAVRALNGGRDFDQGMLGKLDTWFSKYDVQKRLAQAGPKNGVRALTDLDRQQIGEALVPPATAEAERVAEDRFEYTQLNIDAYKLTLDLQLGHLISKRYRQHEPSFRARAEGKTYPWSVLENMSAKAKEQTDNLFGAYKQMPALAQDVNLFDRWEKINEETQAFTGGQMRDLALTVARKYMRNDPKIQDLNALYHVDVNNEQHERLLIRPVLEQVAAQYERQLFEMHRNQPGSCNVETHTITIQRTECPGVKPVQFKWKIFTTLVHEYIHSLAHDDYHHYAFSLDAERKHTLTEGMTDALTRIVIANLTAPMDKVRDALAPGPYRGTYATAADRAEKIFAIAGTENVYAAYFLGRTDLIGAVG